jgi:hypothetical protein
VADRKKIEVHFFSIDKFTFIFIGIWEAPDNSLFVVRPVESIRSSDGGSQHQKVIETHVILLFTIIAELLSSHIQNCSRKLPAFRS